MRFRSFPSLESCGFLEAGLTGFPGPTLLLRAVLVAVCIVNVGIRGRAGHQINSSYFRKLPTKLIGTSNIFSCQLQGRLALPSGLVPVHANSSLGKHGKIETTLSGSSFKHGDGAVLDSLPMRDVNEVCRVLDRYQIDRPESLHLFQALGVDTAQARRE